jgi:uncharacterized membrane protein YbjE (DUF340 family)
VWAGHVHSHTTSEKKSVCVSIIKLMTVIALHVLDTVAKMSTNMSKEIGQSQKSVRLKAKRICSRVMGAIIKKNQIILVTRDTKNRRAPQITMY